jgi:hypothetical protein
MARSLASSTVIFICMASILGFLFDYPVPRHPMEIPQAMLLSMAG